MTTRRRSWRRLAGGGGRFALAVLALSALLAAGLGCHRLGRAPAAATVVILTDFGTKDDSVAICKGVMWSVDSRLRIVDLTHEVPAFDVRTAARLVDGAAPYFPAGTVFVAVVDPGVGTERRAIALRTRAGRLYVGPDNGIFSAVLAREGLDEAREIRSPQVMGERRSATFHGRDVFSPAAAHLAAGVPLAAVGPPVGGLLDLDWPRPVLEEGAIEGAVEFIEEPYGNVVTNIPGDLVERLGVRLRTPLHLKAAGQELTVPFVSTFANVPRDEPLALLSSRDRLCFAVNQGDFARRYGLAPGSQVRVRRGPFEGGD